MSRGGVLGGGNVCIGNDGFMDVLPGAECKQFLLKEASWRQVLLCIPVIQVRMVIHLNL